MNLKFLLWQRNRSKGTACWLTYKNKHFNVFIVNIVIYKYNIFDLFVLARKAVTVNFLPNLLCNILYASSETLQNQTSRFIVS